MNINNHSLPIDRFVLSFLLRISSYFSSFSEMKVNSVAYSLILRL